MRLAMHPLPVVAERAVGHQRVHMQVAQQILGPRMEHQREGQRAAQPERTGAEREQRLCTGREQDVSDEAEIAAGQRVQRMRQGEHQMHIGHRQQFPLTRRDPLFLGAGLALRAMPVPAAVKSMPDRATAVALFDMIAQCGGAAGDDGAPCLGLAAPKRVPGQPGWPVNEQNIGQFDVADAGQGLMPGAQP